MTTRIIDTVEAYQVLEQVVNEKGRDYVDLGVGLGGHWFTEYETSVENNKEIDVATAYSCLIGHWMGAVGVTLDQAYHGILPHAWNNNSGAVSGDPGCEVRVTPEVGKMLSDVPWMNDDQKPWGTILDKVREAAVIGGINLDVTDVAETPAVAEQVKSA